ncbi:MAG TPA: UrcA family protein [Rhizomicrobium sp.]|nr:UrcA family protein [Rhizomicrobium sp.]
MPIHSTRRLALLAASALGLILAAPSAMAQDYGRDDGFRNGPTEEVIVTAPPYRQQRSAVTGAPIQDVAISQPVRFDDLDLRTDWGARTLHERIRTAAHDLCRRLDTLYPNSTDDSPPCYRTALENAMYRADSAIDAARQSDEDARYPDEPE